MSEANNTRTLQNVQTEYSQLCAKAGHLQYQVNALGKDLEQINNTLQALNLEAIKIGNTPAPEAPAAEPAAPNA